MSQNISELNLSPITNEKLVHFINYQLPITNKDLKEHIIREFDNRNLDYRHLYNSDVNELEIKLPLSLIDGCLFERNIPKPPLVGSFYSTVNRLKNFLVNTEELKGKTFKTFDYIFDQLYLPSNIIEVVTEEDINKLSKDDVFIIFKNTVQQFPNQNLLNKIALKSKIILVDKGSRYRGLKNVSILENEAIIKKLSLE
ncbi:hypothetical protein SAMN05443634_106134 [Chishuiella changwenlii]|jgi:hypothetical protein|uniref:Uncharacterized protein n=1 Tax=Chishuiella changwenlii TaxID=1434701 RepID=A0A1M6Y8M3_9FLAO|nr:hypothetical protein [Chishuiella changwenlii]GGE93166.1 hypothetical protein GCM10010984_08490 [Chishuiella changwenlii]SHL14492.1 hypothetical protein SAMN05443634_106134 [Chishuiella changwenlii]